MTASLFALAFAAVPATSPDASVPGQTVYFGTVYPLKSPTTEPTFVYERRVEERDGALLSTHITRDPSGATVLHESATHTDDYRLITYALHTNQLGRSGTVQVDQDRIAFERVEGGKSRTRVERNKGPVVVGPTLVGHIVRHLGQLRSGEVLAVRFAVLDRLETIGFQLRAVESEAGQTRIRMKPSSFLLALLIDPVDFTFETATGKLIRLEGRVPPKVQKGGAWRDFDARVEYRFVADAYR